MTRVPRPCVVLRCPERVTNESGRCPKHERKWNAYPRPSSHARGYNWAWRKPGGIRDQKLTRHPWCAECGTPANEVHHRDGDVANNDPDNLESLCRSCHSSRTRKESASARAL